MGRFNGLKGAGNILGATAIAGAAGYVVQGVAPVFLDGPGTYLRFSVFWSMMYLMIAGASGIQQEMTRASKRDDSARLDGDDPTIRNFTLLVTAAAAVGLPLAALAWGPRIFPYETAQLVAATTTGVTAFVALAVLCGVLYGLGRFRAVAEITVWDALTRLAFVMAVGLSFPSVVALAWAAALPLPLVVVAGWSRHRRAVRGLVRSDVTTRRLVWNSARAVIAALSTGVLTSGLPTIVDATSRSSSSSALGAFVFALVLTRAPFVTVLMALQSFILVKFREAPAGVVPNLRRILAALSAATFVLAVATLYAVPWLLETVWGPAYRIDGWVGAFIVVTAALTGALTVTGAAVLSRDRHTAYTLGWVVAAGVFLLFMLTPIAFEARTLMALTLGPAAGILIHVRSLRGGLLSPQPTPL